MDERREAYRIKTTALLKVIGGLVGRNLRNKDGTFRIERAGVTPEYSLDLLVTFFKQKSKPDTRHIVITNPPVLPAAGKQARNETANLDAAVRGMLEGFANQPSQRSAYYRVYGSPSDARGVSPSSPWATARNYTGAYQSSTLVSSYIGYSNVSGNWTVNQHLFVFDTSAVPASAGTGIFTLSVVTSTATAGDSIELHIVDQNTSMIAGDSLGSYPLLATSASWPPSGGRFSIPISDSSLITRSSNVYIYGSGAKQRNSTEPSADSTANIQTADTSGTADDPQLDFILAAVGTEVVITTTGAGSWTVPTGVTSLKIEAWSAGGGGQIATTQEGGGGGGAYIGNTITVTPGQLIYYNVGAGGAPSIAGGNTLIGNASTYAASTTAFEAYGGVGYPSGLGGASASKGVWATGRIEYGGGAGTAPQGGGGGRGGSGGGGSGGPSGAGAAGAAGISNAGGAGGSGNGGFAVGGGGGAPGHPGESTADGGGGGGGGYGTTSDCTGGAGGDPGGGAGGGGSNAANAGTGGRGQVRFTYQVSSVPITIEVGNPYSIHATINESQVATIDTATPFAYAKPAGYGDWSNPNVTVTVTGTSATVSAGTVIATGAVTGKPTHLMHYQRLRRAA